MDVLGTGTQLNGHTRLTSLDEPAALDSETGGEIFEFNDVLSNDEEDPATQAARKMDWQDFMVALSEREQALIVFVLEGKKLRDLAVEFGVCSSSVQNSRIKLSQAIREFMGEDILHEFRRLPQWKNNLTATQEKVYCRENRR